MRQIQIVLTIPFDSIWEFLELLTTQMNYPHSASCQVDQAAHINTSEAREKIRISLVLQKRFRCVFRLELHFGRHLCGCKELVGTIRILRRKICAGRLSLTGTQASGVSLDVPLVLSILQRSICTGSSTLSTRTIATTL